MHRTNGQTQLNQQRAREQHKLQHRLYYQRDAVQVEGHGEQGGANEADVRQVCEGKQTGEEHREQGQNPTGEQEVETDNQQDRIFKIKQEITQPKTASFS